MVRSVPKCCLNVAQAIFNGLNPSQGILGGFGYLLRGNHLGNGGYQLGAVANLLRVVSVVMLKLSGYGIFRGAEKISRREGGV
jgi:hypothetical protein